MYRARTRLLGSGPQQLATASVCVCVCELADSRRESEFERTEIQAAHLKFIAQDDHHKPSGAGTRNCCERASEKERQLAGHAC